jgi:DNA helicase-2/ATP-dependent DNA helicase PcrA
MAELLPRDTAGLARIPGVGATKLDRYGGDVLAILADA